MFYRSNVLVRSFLTLLIITTLIPISLSNPDYQSKRRHKPSVSFFHDDDEERPKKGLTRDQKAREAWAWHKANLQRLKETHELGLQALTKDIIINDTNNISVIQGDTRLIAPVNLFDLVGLQVQFTPSGSGYTVSTTASPFDTNLGTKLDLTTAPAVNPNPDIDVGDDGYITQSIGFNFTFFGTTFTNVAISSNGNLVFNPGNVSQASFDNGAISSGESLSELQLGLPRIAPYWHDLDAQASATTGNRGIYIRKEATRILVTWNDIRDFPNDPITDNGVHRFQVSLFNDGRITFNYNLVQLTSTALTGISPGGTQNVTSLINMSSPPGNAITNPIGEFFSTSLVVDYIGAIQSFYGAHPNQDVYDFVYFMTDFDFDVGGGAFAFFQPIRNEITGIGLRPFDDDPDGLLGTRKVQGILNLSNILGDYPQSPVTRFNGADHALSIFGQEQGHRWLSFTSFPGNSLLLLGRDDAHWSFFLNIESTTGSPAAPRSSSMEGNVWVDNGNGSFTSVNLVDGFSRLDQYIMGLRPQTEVPDTFVIANPFNTSRTRSSSPRPNTVVSGTKQNVTMNEIIQANGIRNPSSADAPKNFRAAVILLVREGMPPSQATLRKVTLYRLAWESYFAQSTDFLATINTGLADISFTSQNTSRVIAAASAASFKQTLAPGEIAALFGVGLAGSTVSATAQPLPTTLAGVQVLINGSPAPLFFVSPNQINFQVPRTTVAVTANPPVSSSTALIEIIRDGVLIRAGTFQIAPVVPAVFALNQSGTGAAAALDAITGTLGPFNAKQSNGQPNIIAVFGTGLGTDATDVDGDVKAGVQATLNGNAMTVNYAGRAPGFTGLNQMNLTFPQNITAGTYNLIVTRNGIQTRPVTITVK